MYSHCKLTVLIWCASLLLCPTIFASSIFVVAGSVTNPDGQPAEDGLTIIIENQTRELTKQTLSGVDTTPGNYIVVFVAEKEEQVAQSGDVLKISAKDKNGKTLALKIHKITSKETLSARAIVDIQISSAPLSSSIFAVGGKLLSLKWQTMQNDWIAVVENKDRGLTTSAKVGQDASPESYAVAFVAQGKNQIQIVAEVGDKLRITFKDGDKVVNIKNPDYVITVSDIANAKAIIDIQLPSPDVNNDGTVDIRDLVLVGNHFGESGENIQGDANYDGKVDIFDLVMVGKHLGETIPASP